MGRYSVMPSTLVILTGEGVLLFVCENAQVVIIMEMIVLRKIFEIFFIGDKVEIVL